MKEFPKTNSVISSLEQDLRVLEDWLFEVETAMIFDGEECGKEHREVEWWLKEVVGVVNLWGRAASLLPEYRQWWRKGVA